MLDSRVIVPLQSEWAPPVVSVSKSDGSLRFCIEYRKLNAMTICNTYSIRKMDECLGRLGDATLFITLNCNSGYWQKPVAENDVRRRLSHVIWAYTHSVEMTFGLMNAPATFQRMLDTLLSRISMEELSNIFRRCGYLF